MSDNEFSPAFSTAFDPAAAAQEPGGCSWPVTYAGCDADWPDGVDDAAKATFEDMAAWLLAAWTAGRYGTCPVEVRPCRAECLERTSTFWGRGPFPWLGGATGWVPVLLAGHWYNLRCGACGQVACSCDLGCADLVLPGPVASVTEVAINGEALPPGTYRVDQHRHLVRTDGGCWPPCQDLTADADADGAFVVRYVRGAPVPTGGQVAAGRLAIELAKAACDDGTCALPRRVQTITRQGVTIGLLDSFEDVDKGRTGIWLIDSWVAAANAAPPTPARVYSPDLPPRRVVRTTWP